MRTCVAHVEVADNVLVPQLPEMNRRARHVQLFLHLLNTYIWGLWFRVNGGCVYDNSMILVRCGGAVISGAQTKYAGGDRPFPFHQLSYIFRLTNQARKVGDLWRERDLTNVILLS